MEEGRKSAPSSQTKGFQDVLMPLLETVAYSVCWGGIPDTPTSTGSVIFYKEYLQVLQKWEGGSFLNFAKPTDIV